MIEYKIGDLLKDCTAPFLVHQVNCMGIMGGGIAAQIREQNPKVYEDYAKLCSKQRHVGELLGCTQVLEVDNFDPTENCQYIINCFAQERVSNSSKMTSYDALDECFTGVHKYCNEVFPLGCTIGIPYKIGCGLGGGNWRIVEAIITKNFPPSCNVNVEIWVLPEFEYEVEVL